MATDWFGGKTVVSREPAAAEAVAAAVNAEGAGGFQPQQPHSRRYGETRVTVGADGVVLDVKKIR